MILLTTTPEYEYYAVPVPRDVNRVEKRITSLCYKGPNWELGEAQDIGSDFEILGVIAGEQISEEVAEGILKGGSFRPKWLKEDHYSKQLINLLAEKGILVENPIEKPDEVIDNGINMDSRCDQHERNFVRWQSYESRLVKAVILKIKK